MGKSGRSRWPHKPEIIGSNPISATKKRFERTDDLKAVAYALLCATHDNFETSLEALLTENRISPVEVTQAGSFTDNPGSEHSHIFEIRSNDSEEFVLIFHNGANQYSCVVTVGNNYKSVDIE